MLTRLQRCSVPTMLLLTLIAISGDIMSSDQEYNIEGALADEVLQLQNAHKTLYHQISKIRKLKLEQLTSDLELKTLNEVR